MVINIHVIILSSECCSESVTCYIHVFSLVLLFLRNGIKLINLINLQLIGQLLHPQCIIIYNDIYKCIKDT